MEITCLPKKKEENGNYFFLKLTPKNCIVISEKKKKLGFIFNNFNFFNCNLFFWVNFLTVIRILLGMDNSIGLSTGLPLFYSLYLWAMMQTQNSNVSSIRGLQFKVWTLEYVNMDFVYAQEAQLEKECCGPSLETYP